MRTLIAIAALLLSGCAITVGEPVAPSSGPPVAVSESDTPTTQPTLTPSPAATPTAGAPRRVGPPVVADDPVALAGQITLSERAVRQLALGGEELAWMGHLQQLTYRRLVERTDWHEAVLAALPDAALRPGRDGVRRDHARRSRRISRLLPLAGLLPSDRR